MISRLLGRGGKLHACLIAAARSRPGVIRSMPVVTKALPFESAPCILNDGLHAYGRQAAPGRHAVGRGPVIDVCYDQRVTIRTA